MTNTLRTTILIATTALLTALLLHGQRESAPAQVGRFQIVAVVVHTMHGATELNTPGVFRIDTATGECWQYAAGVDDTYDSNGGKQRRIYKGWYPAERPDVVTK